MGPAWPRAHHQRVSRAPRDDRDAAGMVSVPGMRFAGRQVIAPEPGMMVVFPSWLQHCVHPFFGKLVRISVAFNVVVVDYQTGAPGSP